MVTVKVWDEAEVNELLSHYFAVELDRLICTVIRYYDFKTPADREEWLDRANGDRRLPWSPHAVPKSILLDRDGWNLGAFWSEEDGRRVQFLSARSMLCTEAA